jgi:hypothetical protein
MLERSTPRYTAHADAAHEAHVAQDLARAATGIASELGDALVALWLVGAFARGEGGLAVDRGELVALPGYELVAILRKKPERHAVALRSLSGAWSRLLRTRVALSGIGVRDLPHAPRTRFWLEASQGGAITLMGDGGSVTTLPEMDARQLDPEQPFLTLCAALTAIALGELEQASPRSKAERLHTAALAIGDAWLMRDGRFALTRAARARELEHVRDGRALVPAYRDAISFRERPDHWTPLDGEARGAREDQGLVPWLERTRRQLGQLYLACEAQRSETPSHVFGFLRHPEAITRPRARSDSEPLLRRRARLLAMRVPALSSFAVHPLERLLRAAVALAFAADAPACRTQAAGLLRIGTAFGAADDDELAGALRSLASGLLEHPVAAPFARLTFDPPA